MGIEEYCEQAGYYVLFSRFQYADEMDLRKVRLPGVLESNGLTRGVIVAGHVRETFLDVLKKRGITYVALANHVDSEYARDTVNQVRFDDDRGFYDATNYLIQLGHKEIWFIGDTSQPGFRARYDGYRRSMAEHALQPRAQRLALSDNDFDNGRRSLELIVEEGGNMTAVIAGSDDLAQGAIEALRQCGKDVPRDVSVIGFEHMAEPNRAAHLSSVCVDTIQVGRELGRSLIARIRGHGTHIPLTVVPTVLVKRGTCRPLRTETSRMVL
jgi:DNA-binding LacI/PurR family transcriptional regulator